METATLGYIISTVHNTNILPIISACNTSCVFCSHRQNPPEVEVFRLPELVLGDFSEIISYLSPGRKIVIGEAATRIIEGEPLLHPQFIDIMKLIRKKFARTPLQVTTNGTLLERDLVEALGKLAGVELNVSVNCVNPSLRRKVLGKTAEGNIEEKLKLLEGKLRFSGSSVYDPEYMSRNDLDEVVALLAGCGAENVRIFLPGYTKLSGRNLDLCSAARETGAFLSDLQVRYDIPIVLEPAFIEDLECRIEGVVRNSPADIAGLSAGDVIVEVDARPAGTRVEAFDLVFRARDPVITARREGKLFNAGLRKKSGASPGFIVLNDIDPRLPAEIEGVVRNYGARDVAFITSELAAPIMSTLFARQSFSFKYEIITAKNLFFGGNIKCAGLLTAGDVITAGEACLRGNPQKDLILLPPVMFDHTRRDLTRKSIKEIGQHFGIPADTP